MAQKQERIDALRRAGKKHEADILASGGRQRQAEKIAELARRVDSGGFTYTGNTYTLKPGEDYYSLAKRLYGNSAYFSIIAKYNNGLVPKAGMTIKIPVIKSTGGTTPAETAEAASAAAPSEVAPTGYNVQAAQSLQPIAPNFTQLSNQGAFNPVPQQTFRQGQYGAFYNRPSGLEQKQEELAQSIGFPPPQVTLTAPALQTNRMTGDQPTFANPQTGQQQPVVKPGQSGGQNETEIVKNHAVNIESGFSAGRPQFVSPEAAKVLGLEEVLSDTATSGYIFQNGSWRPDPLAQFLLNTPATASINIASGPVARPPISYRRRTAYEITRGDEVIEPRDSFSGGGFSRFGEGVGSVVNWRVSFA